MQEDVNKLRSYSASSIFYISVHQDSQIIKTFNILAMIILSMNISYVYRILCTKALLGPNPFQELSKLSRNQYSSCHIFFMGSDKVFFMNCYNIL